MVTKSLGSYEILEPLGKGGMGEVYRARDPKLKRDVALKLLPDEVAADPERRARLEREAELLAQLDHPNVATIHGMEETEGVSFLVMQLVEGRTLEEITAEGPLSVEDALTLALQVAKGLEAAHRRGIVHRDLKPANVMVTESAGGKQVVKLLDFGLAKAYAPEDTPAETSSDRAASRDLTASPTNLVATEAGTVLGTTAYMSPEQARGKPVDHQTDIWAFGCVLYEMLTGRRAFPGDSLSDVLAAVLKEEPDWSALPPTTPAGVRTLLSRCLRKDREGRLQHVGDARLELADALADRPWQESAERGDPPAEAIGAAPVLPWVVAALATVVAAGALWMQIRDPGGERAPVVRSSIRTEQEITGRGALGGRVAISPDGSRIVYSGRSAAGTRLHVRALDEDTATALDGTEEGLAPFFAPDGSWIGFFADNGLRKVSLETGVVEPLTSALATIGGQWTEDGWIYYTPQPNQGIWRIRDDGTTPEQMTEPDVAAGEAGHYYPRALPGGRALLFTVELAGRSMDQARIDLLSLDTGERRTLVAGGSDARYLPTGHLLYARSGTLVAMPFDAVSLEPTGQPVTVVEGLPGDPLLGASSYDVSDTGTLVYLPGATGGGGGEIAWVDRQGRTTPVALPDGTSWVHPRLSPDGERMVFESRAADDHLWVHEFGQQRPTRLTFELENLAPLWTPDGERITFARHSTGPPNLHWLPAEGGEATALHGSDSPQFPTSWSRDGLRLLYHELDWDTGADIRIFSPEADPASREFLATRFNEDQAVFSPDGRWVAYRSDATGRREVYVRSSEPGSTRQWQVSTDGGAEPVWAPGGGELYFRSGDRLLAVPYAADTSFRASTPEPLFSAPLKPGDFGANYDVAPDGSRFLMVHAHEPSTAATEIRLVLNWFEELERSLVGR